MAQRLVTWNWTSLKPSKMDEVMAVDLNYAALAAQDKRLADAIGRGRIISHHAIHHPHGVLFTFIVDG